MENKMDQNNNESDSVEKTKYAECPLTPRPADFNVQFDWPNLTDRKSPTIIERLEAKTPTLNENIRKSILCHFENVDMRPTTGAKQQLDFGKEHKQVEEKRGPVFREQLCQRVEFVQKETRHAYSQVLNSSRFFY